MARISKPLADFKKQMREAFGNFYSAKGCDCCANVEKLRAAENEIGKLLGVKKYEDKSGYNFYKYKTKDKK